MQYLIGSGWKSVFVIAHVEKVKELKTFNQTFTHSSTSLFRCSTDVNEIDDH